MSKQGILPGFDIGNEHKPVVQPKGANTKGTIDGFVMGVQNQINLVDKVMENMASKDKDVSSQPIPLTDKGRKERTWWWSQTEKASGKTAFFVRVVLGVASPVDLSGNTDILDHEKVQSHHEKLTNEHLEGNSKEVPPTLFAAYSHMTNSTIRNLKDLNSVKAALEAVKAAAPDKLAPYILAAKRYAPTRGNK